MSRRAAPLALVYAFALAAASGAAGACGGTHTLPQARFHDNGDGTVTDTVAMLVWMRCPVGQRWQGGACAGTARTYSLPDAKALADTTNADGSAFFNDWRMPSLRELATITARGCGSPRTDAAVFPDTPAAAFWSATPRPGDSGHHLALSFGDEGVRLARKEDRLHLRLVRTGP